MFGRRPKNRRRNHEQCSGGRQLPVLGRPTSPCRSRDDRCSREHHGWDTPHFEPRRETFLGGLAPGPMGGLSRLSALGGAETPGTFGGRFENPPMGGHFGGGFGRFRDAGDPRFMIRSERPLGRFLRGPAGEPTLGVPNIQDRRLGQIRDFENLGMMSLQHRRAGGHLQRSPLPRPRYPILEDHEPEDFLGYHNPFGLMPQDDLPWGRMPMPMTMHVSPLVSRSASLLSSPSGRGLEAVPRMAGALDGGGGGGGFGNYRAPYVEDYESEIDDLEHALMESELHEQADYLFGRVDDVGGALDRRL